MYHTVRVRVHKDVRDFPFKHGKQRYDLGPELLHAGVYMAVGEDSVSTDGYGE
jgi:hypothetical protein